MTATPEDAAPDSQRIIGDLQRQLHEARAELGARNSAYSERIAYQAAANDVLKVMSASPGDPQPVFDLISVRARDICDAYGVTVYEFDGSLLHWRAATGVSEDPAVREAAKAAFPLPPTPDLAVGRAILSRAIVHIRDYETEPGLRRFSLAVKSTVVVPLIRGGVPIGALQMGSRERGGFSDAQVGLLETFADQAVIAIENARLFNETKEALERQTATAEILKVIASSPSDVLPVFEVIVGSAKRLLGGFSAAVVRVIDGIAHLEAITPTNPVADAITKNSFPRPVVDFQSFAMAQAGKVVQISDTEALSDDIRNIARARGYRSVLLTPMKAASGVIGMINVTRKEAGTFGPEHVELIKTFADQAVIAIENARLFEELRERQAELRVTFDNMGDGVVMFGADKKLAAWNRNLQEMLDLPDALLLGRPSSAELFRYLAARGEFGSADLEAELGRSVEDTSREMRYERTRPDGRIIEVRRNPVPDGGFVLIYADITERKRAEEAIRLARDAAEKALRDLQTAQDRLIQTEKLASLGQLTAGIAHEIKNPLNFVNNFSSLSAELIGELNDLLKGATLEDKMRKDVEELTRLLQDNLEKIVLHGRRADSIVKNMLLHSREGSREQRPADVNALVEESLNLAYHGARAEKSSFEITLQREFDSNAGIVEVFPQEISRALLNLISNGFYAATKRKAENDGAGVEPTIFATTKNLGTSVEIRIRDNGTGIPPEVRGKMFNPFFTTKPTGEGTGLGLSMTHDIIVKQHGGSIDVETRLGEFTEFIITLPRNNGRATGEKPE